MDPTPQSPARVTAHCTIGEHKGQPFILCHHCHRRSYNVNDVEARYCGFCHQFHDDRDAA
jgi:ribosomal protein L37E